MNKDILIGTTYNYIGIYKHQIRSFEYFILEIDKEVGTMTTNRCIKNLLKLICLLQENSQDECCIEEGCTKPFLGPTINCICYNTRVVTFYNKRGTLITANYVDTNGATQTSSLFRVENVSDNCVTLRVLYRNDDTYVASNSFININLGCICAVQCIEDAVVSNI